MPRCDCHITVALNSPHIRQAVRRTGAQSRPRFQPFEVIKGIGRKNLAKRINDPTKSNLIDREIITTNLHRSGNPQTPPSRSDGNPTFFQQVTELRQLVRLRQCERVALPTLHRQIKSQSTGETGAPSPSRESHPTHFDFIADRIGNMGNCLSSKSKIHHFSTTKYTSVMFDSFS